MLEIDADDVYVFLLIEEETSRFQAQRQLDIQRDNERLRSSHPTH
jgi:hypothetical protein